MSPMLDLDRIWTLDDLADLSDEFCKRVEIVDGLLIVSPPPVPRHTYVGDILFVLLANAAPAWLHVSGSDAGFEFGRSYRKPDLSVLHTSAYRTSRALLDTADLVLAVEIESPSSITTDRITKPAQYAAAGIAHYWRVETDPLRLVTYRLGDGAYAETGAWSVGEVAAIDEPFAAEIDVAALFPS
ncbi:Uma2 family endonuclease [uncultured Jatrophihabitans sp.]|uniref:Uma2 family endonuclease n=1 Tax=uncultured Jatrophihabitans sp. TaxID=1610747 RepID=UPI0035CAB826